MIWTPEQLMIATYLMSGLCGASVYLVGSAEWSFRTFCGKTLWSANAGLTVSMLSFTMLGGVERPWRVIAAGATTALGWVKGEDMIRTYMKGKHK